MVFYRCLHEMQMRSIPKERRGDAPPRPGLRSGAFHTRRRSLPLREIRWPVTARWPPEEGRTCGR